jgi:predicted dehydrogenase
MGKSESVTIEQIEPITAILIGAGQRGGEVFGKFALNNPSKLSFVAVAEPRDQYRKLFAEEHQIAEGKSFNSWEEILQPPKLAEVAIIATPDHIHEKPAVSALKLGYDLLLEKPIGVKLEEVKTIVETAEKLGRKVQICHVLRYTPFYSSIHQLITNGEIGKVVNISARENVSYWHYAHSFIRGNWHNREKASPMILAKCCHDLDLLYWFAGAKANSISSYGSLRHFGRANKPSETPERYTDGCPVNNTCLYDAVRFYSRYPDDYFGWPVSVISVDQTIKGRVKALKNGPYGKCVYAVEDHDVVDHQVVSIEFENKITATLTMHGFAHEEGRTIRIDGTKGTIIGEFIAGKNKLTIHDSLTGEIKEIKESDVVDGHGGGDLGLLDAFVKYIKEDDNRNVTSAKESLESHLMAFAADISRVERRRVKMEEVRE